MHHLDCFQRPVDLRELRGPSPMANCPAQFNAINEIPPGSGEDVSALSNPTPGPGSRSR